MPAIQSLALVVGSFFEVGFVLPAVTAFLDD
jgi:hypothetical protein